MTMKKKTIRILGSAFCATILMMNSYLVHGQETKVTDVTPENFVYAESSMYFQKQQDKFPVNQWQHVRQMATKTIKISFA